MTKIKTKNITKKISKAISFKNIGIGCYFTDKKSLFYKLDDNEYDDLTSGCRMIWSIERKYFLVKSIKMKFKYSK